MVKGSVKYGFDHETFNYIALDGRVFTKVLARSCYYSLNAAVTSSPLFSSKSIMRSVPAEHGSVSAIGSAMAFRAGNTGSMFASKAFSKARMKSRQGFLSL